MPGHEDSGTLDTLTSLVMHTASPKLQPHARTPQMSLGARGGLGCGGVGGVTRCLYLFLFPKWPH